MADIESNINININTSAALAEIKNLQREISAFHSNQSKKDGEKLKDATKIRRNLLDNINATNKFAASLQKVNTTAESFTNALEKNKLSLREYFRYGRVASKNFKEGVNADFDAINKVARERVKDLQTQYIKLGRDASGAVQAIKVRPLRLDMNDLGTVTQMASQRMQIFNQLLKQGSTNLLNWGKNTQWAGRQLMVGFTIPLSIFGTQAAKIFMDLEKQAIKFRRVYGDLFTAPEETEKVIEDLRKLSLEFTKYGVAVEETMGLAADAAAMGKTGAELLAQVAEANRLAVLGNVEQSKALDTTISVTNAFGIAAEDLANKIDFLNAVENQTVTSIEDLTIAIPKAGPVVRQLGGSVEDLAFFLTAMKEGGINASEGANALKSGLASLINPTKQAKDMLTGFGINITDIVSRNAGDAKGTIIEFATALDKLDPLNRAQAIEQLFGKFQFSRISTLFQNVIGEGTQAQRVLEMANSSASELARLSSQELGNVAESSTYKFEAAVERLKVAIAPIGEQFIKAVTPIVDGITKIADWFNSLPDIAKNAVTLVVGALGLIGPVALMTVGLVANGIAMLIKGFAKLNELGQWMRGLGRDTSTLGSQTSYMSQEQIEAASIAASLEQAHMRLEQRFTSEAEAIRLLTQAYNESIIAQNKHKADFGPLPNSGKSRKNFANGGMVRGPGGPKDDAIPANLSNGEAVIDAETVKKNPSIIAALFAGKKINVPGYANNNSSQFNLSARASSAGISSVTDWIRADIPNGKQIVEQVIAELSSSVNVGAKEVLNSLRRVSEEINGEAVSIERSNALYAKAAGTKEGPLSRSGATTIAQDVARNPELLPELERAKFLQQRMQQEYGFTPQMTRSHTEKIDSIGKNLPGNAGWSPAFYQLELDPVNQLSNTLTEGISNFDPELSRQYMAQLDEMDKLGEDTAGIRYKLANNLGLEAKESEQQARILNKILANEAEAAKIRPQTRKYMEQTVFLQKEQAAYDAKNGQLPSPAQRNPEKFVRATGQYNTLRGRELETASPKIAEIRKSSDKAVLAALDEFDNSLIKSAEVKSPSKKTKKATDGIIDGIVQSLTRNQKKVSSAFTKTLNNAVMPTGSQSLLAKNMAADPASFVTAKNSRLVSSINQQVKDGLMVIPSSIKSQSKIFNAAGGQIVSEISSSIIQNSKKLQGAASTVANSGIVGAGPGKRQAAATEEVTKSMGDMNSKIMAATGMFSAMSMVSSMAGVDIGEFGNVVTNMTTLLFSLSLVTQALTTEKMKEIFATRAVIKTKLAETFSPVTDAIMNTRANAGGKILSGGLKGSFKNIGDLFKNLGGVVRGLVSKLPYVVRLLGPIGAAFGTMLIVTNLINKAREKELKAIKGLGDVARLSADKIDKLASMTGTQVKQTPFEMALAGISVPAGLSQDQQQVVFDLATSEDFKTEFASEIASIESGSQERVAATLRSLAINLQAKGFEWDTINNIIYALQAAAGRTDVKIDFSGISIGVGNIDYEAEAEGIALSFQSALDNEDYTLKFVPQIQLDNPKNENDGFWDNFFRNIGEAAIIEGQARTGQLEGQFTPDLSTDQQAAYNDTVVQTLNLINSLSSAFNNAELDSDSFNSKFSEIMAGITGSIEDPVLIDSFMDRLLTDNFSLDPAIAQLNNFESQTKLLGLAAMGITPSIDQMQAILEGSADDASTDRINAMADAFNTLFNAASETEAANIEAAAALDVSAIENEISALGDTKKAYDNLVGQVNELTGEKISEAEAYAMATDEKWKALTLDALEKGSLQEVIQLRQEYNDALANQPTEPPPTFTELKEDIEERINGLRETSEQQVALEAAGYSAAEAQAILADDMWKAAFAAAVTAEEVLDLKAAYEEFTALTDDGFSGGKGAPTKSPYELAIDQLKEQKKEILDNKSAYGKLREEGFNVSTAYEAAGDSVLAAALASTKVGTKKWEELIKLVKDYNKEQAKMDIADQTRQNNMEIQRINNIGKIEEGLAAAGYSAETISTAIDQIGDNPNILSRLVADLKDGEVNAQNIVDLLESIDGITIAIELNKTPEELRQDALNTMSVLNSYFSAQGSAIENAFKTGQEAIIDQYDKDGKKTEVKINTGKVNISQLEKDIAAAEEYIASRQYQIDDFQYGLDQIAKNEEEVNKKYDDRIKALDKIEELNSQIAEGQKSQLDVATALASGDIAAAARAMQEDEARRAKAVVEQQRKDLETARETELKNIAVTVNGEKLTRLEIEEKISDLQDEIAKKEENALEPKQRSLDLANAAMQTAIDSLTHLGNNKSAWKAIEDQLILANIQIDKYYDTLKKIADGEFNFDGSAPASVRPTNTVGASTPKSLAGSTTYGNVDLRAEDPKAFAEARAAEERALLARDDIGPKAREWAEKRLASYEATAATYSLGGQVLKRQMGGSILGYASGGRMSRFLRGKYSMGTDTVPAMLTPGEFVVRRPAVRKFGLDRLKAINSGATMGGSVYNYSVNVNVSTDADPDRIARAVMTEIKRTDSQRIRKF